MNKLYYYLAVVISAVTSAFAAILLNWIVHLVRNLAYLNKFSFEYFEFTTSLNLSASQIIFTPVIGSFFVIFLIRNVAHDAGGHGVAQVMQAISHGDSLIRPRVAFVKLATSAISLGTGGVGGMEGPIVQISASLGASNHYIFKNISSADRNNLISCGVAGGLASAFGAPLTGVFFALELITPKHTPKLILSVIASVLIAIFVRSFFLGNNYFLEFEVLKSFWGHDAPYLVFVFLGILCGLVAVFFMYLLYFMENYFDKLKANQYLIHASSMFFVGVIIYFIYINAGYYKPGSEVIFKLDNNHLSLKLLLILLPVKLFMTSLCLGSGGAGGVFSPSIYTGSLVGAIYYFILVPIFPSLEGHMLELVFAGMAGVVGGTTSALLTATFIVPEMTGQYQFILPILATTLCSSVTRNLLTPYSIYTIKHSRKA